MQKLRQEVMEELTEGERERLEVHSAKGVEAVRCIWGNLQGDRQADAKDRERGRKQEKIETGINNKRKIREEKGGKRTID